MSLFNITKFCLETNREKHPGKTALLFLYENENRKEFTFYQFYQSVLGLGNLLQNLSLEKSDRILIRLENSPEYAVSFFGIMAAGFTAVPLSPQLTEEEVEYILKDSGAKCIIYSDHLKLPSITKNILLIEEKSILQELKPDIDSSKLFQTQKEDPAFLIYTSGTTGFPKGVLHAHRNILGRIPMRKGWNDLRETDRVLHAGQLNWTYTLGAGLLDPFSAEASTILFNGKANPEKWLEIIQKEKATLFVGVPSLYRRILKYSDFSKYDLTSLRHCLTAGEALLAELRNQWKEKTGKEMYEALGMSEISTYISTSPTIPYKPGSPGKPQEGRRVCILPVEDGLSPLPAGERGILSVHNSDPGLLLQYWNSDQEISFRGEWFLTGDLAHIDEEGYVFYHGRNDDVMNSFGYRVSPNEVERVLSQLPFLAEVGVTEIPKPDGISLIAAFIVLKEPHEPEEFLKKEIFQYAQNHLAHYKNPREIFFVKELPHNKNGKLMRKKLMELSQWENPT